MQSTYYYIIAASIAILSFFGSILKFVFGIGQTMKQIESNQMNTHEKIDKIFNVVYKIYEKVEGQDSRLSNHDVRIAVNETKIQNIQNQNGKHSDFDA